MKVQELHDEIMKTEELILFLKNMEDENTLLSSIAIHYLNIIRNIGHETSARAQLEMVRDKLQNEFEQLEPREEN